MRVVGVEHGEARHRHGPPGKRAAAPDRLRERVGQREGEIGAAVANQLEVVDRAEVTSAVARTPGRLSLRIFAMPPPYG